MQHWKNTLAALLFRMKLWTDQLVNGICFRGSQVEEGDAEFCFHPDSNFISAEHLTQAASLGHHDSGEKF